MKKDIGAKLADGFADFVGSWKFIMIQTVVLGGWMFINLDHLVNFDPYPFILMNLLLSAQAAYATPMILMSSNRQAQKDHAVSKEQHLLLIKKVDELIEKVNAINKPLTNY